MFAATSLFESTCNNYTVSKFSGGSLLVSIPKPIFLFMASIPVIWGADLRRCSRGDIPCDTQILHGFMTSWSFSSNFLVAFLEVADWPSMIC